MYLDYKRNSSSLLMDIAVIIIMISFVSYLLFNIKRAKNNNNLFEEKQQKLVERENVERDIDKIQNKVDNLQSNNIDPDLLDELIRKQLSLGKKNETIMYNN